MSDQDTWRFINTFAPWFSAFGTLAAAITSLYLARRADQIRLKITAGIRLLAVHGEGSHHGTRWVFVSITNTGRRSATITHLFWRPVPWRKFGVVWIVPQNAYSSPLPITLGDGQMANIACPVDEFRQKFSGHARELFSGMIGGAQLRLTRMCVATSTGKAFRRKLEKDLQELLRDMATGQGGTEGDRHLTPFEALGCPGQKTPFVRLRSRQVTKKSSPLRQHRFRE